MTGDLRANSLKDHYQEWLSLGAPAPVLQWIKGGVQLPFQSIPCHFQLANRPLSKVQESFVDGEIKALLNTGAISVSKVKPHCVSPIGCVPKKRNKYRLIVDLRQFNGYCRVPSFVNENIETVCRLIETNDDLYTIDLKNGFHHVGVHPDFRKYLGIYWRGIYYVWNVLPFGLGASPYFFQKTVRPVVEWLRSQGIRLVFYVDDCLLMVEKSLSDQHLRLVLEKLQSLGWIINGEKSSLSPSNSVEYIGYIVCSLGPSDTPWLKIPQKRIRKLRYGIKRTLTSGKLTARRLAGIAGQCVAMTRVVVPGKLLLRNVYRLLRQRSGWEDTLLLSPEAAKDLMWWDQALSTWNGCPIVHKCVDCQITTDASASGWGAYMDNLKAAGFWNLRISRKPSNYREMLAILMALKSFRKNICGKTVQIMSDNITAIAYINHLGGPSADLSQLAKAIWAEAYTNSVHLICRHIAGSKNTLADALSRLNPQYEWRLHPAMFQILERQWGPHTMDRFASLTNTQLPRYNSRFWDPLTSGVDALAQQDWAQENNFVNPPFRLIPQVLDIVTSQRCEITLIAPLWRAQPWFRKLQEMSVAPPIRIPRKKTAMWLMKPVPEPLRNKGWKIYAWRLSGIIQ
jgi:ribonuclease HI